MRFKPASLLFLSSVLFLSAAAITYAAPSLPTVAIVTTGGTIAEKIDPKTGQLVPAVTGDDLVKAIPTLPKIANINVFNFSNIDSSQMSPAIWLKLSKKVNQILKDPTIKGIVITHGTDTMSEGSYFLSLTTRSQKPIVFTGAMRDASDPYPDGYQNIIDAVRLASSKEGKKMGVTVTLNQYINSACSVRKDETTNPQTFDSGEDGYLGYIEEGKISQFHQQPRHLYFPLPKKLPRVVLATTYAGDDGSLIRQAVDQGAEGIVVEAFGAGNVNKKVYHAIKYALKKKTAVVITSQVQNGSVYPVYGDIGGGSSLKKAGAILGGDLPGAKARILLMLALTQSGNDWSKLSRYFQGELC